MLRLSQTPFRELTTHMSVPAGIAEDGALIVVAPVDLISWTATAAKFATLQPSDTHAVLCTDALLTDRARDGFKAQGWRIEAPREVR